MATSAVTNTFVVSTTIDPDTVNENFGNLVNFDNTKVVHRDGSKAMTGAFDAGNQKLVNVQAGTDDTDAANIANVDAVLPVGMMTAYGGSSAPSGWLLCQGQAVSRVTYSALFTAIGTSFGVGDGVTTFELPDLQDKYPIGKSGTVAVGAEVGSNNAVAVNHGHGNNFSASSSGGSHSHGDNIAFTTSNPGGHAHGFGSEPLLYATTGGVGGYFTGVAGTTINNTSSINWNGDDGRHTHTMSKSGGVSTSTSHAHTISVSGSVTDYTSDAGTNKNRPASVGVNWIIRSNV